MKKNIIFLICILTSSIGKSQIDSFGLSMTDFGFGHGLTLGTNVITGDLSQNFRTVNFGFDWTIEIIYKNWNADIGLKFIYAPNKQPFEFENQTYQRKQLYFTSLFYSLLGYDILKNTNFRLIPFTGFGYGRLEKSEKLASATPNSESMFLKRFGYVNSGIMIDWLSKQSFKSVKKLDFRARHPIPSVSWRLKIEYIQPILKSPLNETLSGRIFQLTIGGMIYVHGQKNPMTRF
jgi:hypothetical protein